MRCSVPRSFLLASAVCALGLLTPRAAAAQWISYSTNPRNILEGNWQSCQDLSGRYAERVYDHVVNGEGLFEVHLGPRREFAIFQGVQDEHREHSSPDNLLKPFRVLLEGSRARQQWEIPLLNLRFTVAMGGGSTTDCESWYILLEPLDKKTH